MKKEVDKLATELNIPVTAGLILLFSFGSLLLLGEYAYILGILIILSVFVLFVFAGHYISKLFAYIITKRRKK